MGLPLRETRIGALSSACGRRARFANTQALLAISDFRHAESRTAGAWLQSQTRLRDIVPQTPFFASQRFEQRCHAVRMRTARITS